MYDKLGKTLIKDHSEIAKLPDITTMSPTKRNDLTHAETVIKDPDIIVLNDVETYGTLLHKLKLNWNTLMTAK